MIGKRKERDKTWEKLLTTKKLASMAILFTADKDLLIKSIHNKE